MSEKYESAKLILRLYELRREETMRKARAWFTGSFFPENGKDIMATVAGEHGADFRMVLSYWDNAAALVTHGAIDAAMFNDMNTEHVVVYSIIQPCLEDVRKVSGLSPYFYAYHLESTVRRIPNLDERMNVIRVRMKKAREAGEKKTGG